MKAEILLGRSTSQLNGKQARSIYIETHQSCICKWINLHCNDYNRLNNILKLNLYALSEYDIIIKMYRNILWVLRPLYELFFFNLRYGKLHFRCYMWRMPLWGSFFALTFTTLYNDNKARGRSSRCPKRKTVLPFKVIFLFTSDIHIYIQRGVYILYVYYSIYTVFEQQHNDI